MDSGQGSAVVSVVGTGGSEGLELCKPLPCLLIHQLQQGKEGGREGG